METSLNMAATRTK